MLLRAGQSPLEPHLATVPSGTAVQMRATPNRWAAARESVPPDTSTPAWPGRCRTGSQQVAAGRAPADERFPLHVVCPTYSGGPARRGPQPLDGTTRQGQEATGSTRDTCRSASNTCCPSTSSPRAPCWPACSVPQREPPLVTTRTSGDSADAEGHHEEIAPRARIATATKVIATPACRRRRTRSACATSPVAASRNGQATVATSPTARHSRRSATRTRSPAVTCSQRGLPPSFAAP